MVQTCIGIDIGRSSVKAMAAHGGKIDQLLIPSAVCKAFDITDDTERVRARKDTVLIGTIPYFFGETALLQGQSEMTNGYSDDFALSEQHSALFLGTLNRLNDQGIPGVESGLIVVGLPANTYAAHKNQVVNELSKLAPKAEIRILPQPLGPYQEMMFTDDGSENISAKLHEQNWAVVEVGQFTTDYALLMNGRPIEHAAGSCDGMSKAAENLARELLNRGLHVSMPEATQALATRQIKDFGKLIDISVDVERAVAPIATQIIDKATQLFGKVARSLDGVLVAGGGASLVHPHMLKRWPHCVMPANPRFAVANGFCRYALALNKFRSSQAKVKEAA